MTIMRLYPYQTPPTPTLQHVHVSLNGSHTPVDMTTYLVDHELCHPLVELAVGAVEDHLQHVSVHLLHDNVDLHTGRGTPLQ